MYYMCEKGLNCSDCPNFDLREVCEYWVEAKPVVRGHWEGDKYPVCSECRSYPPSDKENIRIVDNCYEDINSRVKFYKDVRYDIVYHKTAFCPHCGAKMYED